MEDPLNYTYDGLERELNLLEIHLKEAPKGDEAFCQDCIDKHISTSRGFALEGPGFTDDKNEQEKFLEAEKQLREIKVKDYKKQGVELAQKVRNIRKSLTDDCPDCSDSIKKIPKGLNNNPTFNNHKLNNHKLNINKTNMAKITYGELAGFNVGQFAAEGVRYLLEARPPTPTIEKVITIGGGVALQALGLFLKKPQLLKSVALVAGSNLFAGGVVKLVKGGAVAGVVRARAAVAPAGQGVGGYAGKTAAYAPVAGGPVFKGRVTATGIPTQYERASVLAEAQAYSAPEHADLIRVD